MVRSLGGRDSNFAIGERWPRRAVYRSASIVEARREFGMKLRLRGDVIALSEGETRSPWSSSRWRARSSLRRAR